MHTNIAGKHTVYIDVPRPTLIAGLDTHKNPV